MRRQATVEGRQRSYLQLDPDLPDGAAPSALVIVLHGSSQTGRSIRAFSGLSFDLLARDFGAVVIYADGVKKLWNHDRPPAAATDDVAFMSVLARDFRNRHGALPIYIAGFSNGGQLLIRLIHEIPDCFDGAAIIGATLPRPANMHFRDVGRPMPVMLVHGTHDMVVPYGGEGWFGSLFGRKRGPSALDTAQYFAARNLVSAAPTRTVLPHRRASGRTSVTLAAFEQDGRERVWLFTVAGGGHVVPNRSRKAFFLAGRTTQDVSVPEAMADFWQLRAPGSLRRP